MQNTEQREVIVELSDIRKTFAAKNRKTEVLKGVGLQLFRGEFGVIMGKSGCGKSTLMSILAGLDKADSGMCKVNNKEIIGLRDRELARYRNEEIGIVFQAFFLDESRTLAENIEIPMGYRGIGRKERKKRSAELIHLFGLDEVKDKKPSQVSGGEQQRAAIARAIVNEPSVLLADEPTGNLDEENTKMVLELLAELNRKGMTLLIVTHDEYVASFADRIFTIENGVIKD